MKKMSVQFRLGYKLGRLHGRLQYAEQTTQVWNGYVAQLNDANASAAQNFDNLHSEAATSLSTALEESGVTINDLDEVNLTPASRKERRKMKRAERDWNHQRAEESVPLP